MKTFTQDEMVAKVHDAVERSERSFGGTFKRLTSERDQYKKSTELAQKLVIAYEAREQLREIGAVPKRFIDMKEIQYSDDLKTLQKNVKIVIEKGRDEFEQILKDHGISLRMADNAIGNEWIHFVSLDCFSSI